jgi:hypothetical protein
MPLTYKELTAIQKQILEKTLADPIFQYRFIRLSLLLIGQPREQHRPILEKRMDRFIEETQKYEQNALKKTTASDHQAHTNYTPQKYKKALQQTHASLQKITREKENPAFKTFVCELLIDSLICNFSEKKIINSVKLNLMMQAFCLPPHDLLTHFNQWIRPEHQKQLDINFVADMKRWCTQKQKEFPPHDILSFSCQLQKDSFVQEQIRRLEQIDNTSSANINRHLYAQAQKIKREIDVHVQTNYPGVLFSPPIDPRLLYIVVPFFAMFVLAEVIPSEWPLLIVSCIVMYHAYCIYQDRTYGTQVLLANYSCMADEVRRLTADIEKNKFQCVRVIPCNEVRSELLYTCFLQEDETLHTAATETTVSVLSDQPKAKKKTRGTPDPTKVVVPTPMRIPAPAVRWYLKDKNRTEKTYDPTEPGDIKSQRPSSSRPHGMFFSYLDDKALQAQGADETQCRQFQAVIENGKISNYGACIQPQRQSKLPVYFRSHSTGQWHPLSSKLKLATTTARVAAYTVRSENTDEKGKKPLLEHFDTYFDKTHGMNSF